MDVTWLQKRVAQILLLSTFRACKSSRMHFFFSRPCASISGIQHIHEWPNFIVLGVLCHGLGYNMTGTLYSVCVRLYNNVFKSVFSHCCHVCQVPSGLSKNPYLKGHLHFRHQSILDTSPYSGSRRPGRWETQVWLGYWETQVYCQERLEVLKNRLPEIQDFIWINCVATLPTEGSI